MRNALLVRGDLPSSVSGYPVQLFAVELQMSDKNHGIAIKSEDVEFQRDLFASFVTWRQMVSLTKRVDHFPLTAEPSKGDEGGRKH